MNVLICCSEYYPHGSGIANVVHNVNQRLSSKGLDCKICSPNGPDIYLGNFNLITKFGIIGLIYYWLQVQIYFQKKKGDYDVVWCHNPIFLTKCPFDNCVVTVHSTYIGKFILPFNTAFRKLYLYIASKLEKYSYTHLPSHFYFTGVNLSICGELKTLGIPDDRIHCIYNGVNTDKFKPFVDPSSKKKARDKFGIPENNLVFLSVGRLTSVKQPLKLIDFFAFIQNKLENVSLVFAGDGDLLNVTKSYVKNLNLDNVFFLGHVNYETDLPALYSCSDFYVISSSYEGQPLTLLEAISSGLFSIVSNIPSLRFVDHDNLGIVIDFSNMSDYNLALDYIINKSSNSLKLRTYAVNNLEWDIVTNKYLSLFTSII